MYGNGVNNCSSSRTVGSSTASLINNAFTSSLGGSAYRVKWNSAYNSSWIFENCDAISNREGTQTLFEHLINSKEVIANPTKPIQSHTITLPDYEFEKPTLSDQKRYLLAQLNAQMDMAQAVCLESPFFSLLRKRLLITNRLLYALYSKFHDQVIEPCPLKRLNHSPIEGDANTSQPPVILSSNPTEILIDMGIRMSLNLVFNLLRLNQNKEQSSLCADVFETAKTVIWSLPAKSLANDKALAPLAIRSLNEVTEFLKQLVVTPSSVSTCRKLGAEIILGIALQRCSLNHLLEWIQMALNISELNEGIISISYDIFHTALTIIHHVPENSRNIENLEQDIEPMNHDFGDSIPVHIAAVKLLEELVTMSIADQKGINTPHGVSSASLSNTNSVRSLPEASTWTTNYWTSTNENPIKLLMNFILKFGLESSEKPKPPFSKESDSSDFVVLCLKLLNGQLRAQSSFEIALSTEKLIVELRNMCFKMLDMDLSLKIQKSVAETLGTGGLILPPLNEKLSLLLSLLKDVKTLTRGQQLLCEIIFSSLEDRQKVAQLLGLSRSKKSKDNLTLEELKWTEQLIVSLLVTLAEDGLAKISQDTNEQTESVISFTQRLHGLLTSLQNHMLAHCVCGAEMSLMSTSSGTTGTFDKIIWGMLKTQLAILFESSSDILKRAEEVLDKNPEAHIRLANTLFQTIGGSMLSRILHSMLLPINHNFHDLLSQLITLLMSMESFARKLPHISLHSYHVPSSAETFTDDEQEITQEPYVTASAWTWFTDMERTCSHLVGRLLGDLIRGSHISTEETLAKHWLTCRIFSHGLESSKCLSSLNNIQEVLARVTHIFIERDDSWIIELNSLLKAEFPPELGSLFALVLPAQDSCTSSVRVRELRETNAGKPPFDLLLEHGNSLDWHTCDVTDDRFMDSVSRLVLLALMKHTGIADQYNLMTMSQRRQNCRLNEIFALVFHIRTRLMVLKHQELLVAENSGTDANSQLTQPKQKAMKNTFDNRNENYRNITATTSQDSFGSMDTNDWDDSDYFEGGRHIELLSSRLRPDPNEDGSFSLYFDEETALSRRSSRNQVYSANDIFSRSHQFSDQSQDNTEVATVNTPRCTGLNSTTQEMEHHIRENINFRAHFGAQNISSDTVANYHGTEGLDSDNYSNRDIQRVPVSSFNICERLSPYTTSGTPGTGRMSRGRGRGRGRSETQGQGLIVTPNVNEAPLIPQHMTSNNSRNEDVSQFSNSRNLDNSLRQVNLPNALVGQSSIKMPNMLLPTSRSESKVEIPLSGQTKDLYQELAQRIIEKSLVLLLFVKYAAINEATTPITSARETHEETDSNQTSLGQGSSLEEFYHQLEEDVELPSVKSSDTFCSPESVRGIGSGVQSHRIDNSKVGQLIVRKLGRSILRFLAAELIGSKQDWFADVPGAEVSSNAGLNENSSSNEGWDSDPNNIISAMKKQEIRATERICALERIITLVYPQFTNEDESSKNSCDFLSSVHEFFIAGCFQLGLSSPIQVHVKPDTVIFVMSNTDTAVCHYLDGVQSAPIVLQKQVTAAVHTIMQWMISNLKAQANDDKLTTADTVSSSSSMCPLQLHGDDTDNDDFIPQQYTEKPIEITKSVKNDEVKLLNLFTLSCRFSALDIRLVVQSGLLSVLKHFSIPETPDGNNKCTATSHFNQDLWALPCSQYVSMASTRLLWMLAVATTIHAGKLEDEVIEKVVEVLYTQLTSLLRLLCGAQFSLDGDLSATPTGTPDTPLISVSPIEVDYEAHVHANTFYDKSPFPLPTRAEKLEMEARLGDYLLFLRRLASESSMGKFFSTSHWIKLILSFLSVKPCNAVATFLKLDEEEEDITEARISPNQHRTESASSIPSNGNPRDNRSEETFGFSKFPIDLLNLQTSRNILFTSGLRPRLLAIQFLESLLTNLPLSSSDLRENAAKELLQQLSDSLWTVPFYERAKKNIMDIEEISRSSSDLRFDPEKCSCSYVENNGQTLVHGKGGRGIGLTNLGFTSGCHHWKFLIVKENKGNEGVCVGVSRTKVIGKLRDQSHRSTEDMYLYRAYSGNLYNKGEVSFSLPNFTQGDCITCILDFDNKTLSFGKNHDEPILAFQNIEAHELYPCVLFYSTNPGEKVKITDYEPRTTDRSLLAGEPFCAPFSATLAESYISLIRTLHSSNDGWTRTINDSLMERLHNGKDILYDAGGDKTPTPTLVRENSGEEDEGEVENKLTPNNAEEIERLCKEVMPALAVIGGIDRGLRIGLKCIQKSSGKRAIILGTPKAGVTSSVKVQWDDNACSITDTPVSGLEPIPFPPFDMAKFTCLSADILRFLTKLSGITDEVRFPNQKYNKLFESSPEAELSSTETDRDTEMTISIKCIKHEGTERSFWRRAPNSLWQGSSGSNSLIPGNYCSSNNQGSIGNSTVVDALSSRMVTDIISEVTRKTSVECNFGQTRMSTRESSVDDNDKPKGHLELENSFLKMAFMQFGSMKCLSNVFSCSHFAEFILVPKKHKLEKDPSSSETKENEPINTDGNSCLKCGKLIENGDECPYCTEIASFQAVLAETFQHIVNMSVKPCRIEQLVPLSDIERAHSIIHHIHLKQVVDFGESKLKPQIPHFVESEEIRSAGSIGLQEQFTHDQSLEEDPIPSSVRNFRRGSPTLRNGSLPITLAGLAGRLHPECSIHQSTQNRDEPEVGMMTRTTLTEDLMDLPAFRDRDNNEDSRTTSSSVACPFYSGSGRGLSRVPAVRRRSRRSPSPPPIPLERLPPLVRQFGAPLGTTPIASERQTRIPPALIEMGFAPRHIRQAMTALGISVGPDGTPSVNVVSQLASWMIENPSIEHEERDHRFIRPWSLSRSQNSDEQGERRRLTNSPANSSNDQNYPTTFAHQVVLERLTFQEALNRNQSSRQASQHPSNDNESRQHKMSCMARIGYPSLPSSEAMPPVFKIPVVNISTQAGELGLCCFCCNLESNISHHLCEQHKGCGFQLNGGYCGEIRGECYWLCFNCYEHNGTHDHLFYRETVYNTSENSLALPPLTMTPNNSENDNTHEELVGTDAFFQAPAVSASSHEEMIDGFTPLLPYLGLKKEKPYPNHIHLKDSDVLGSETVDKVVQTKTNSSDSYGINSKMVEQAMFLVEPSRRIEALENTTAYAVVMIARNIMLKILTLLSVSEGSCDLTEALAKVGLSDVNELIKLMCLTAANRIQPPGEEPDDKIRFCNNESDRFLNLPYNMMTCIRLQYIGKAVEALILHEPEATKGVLDLCTKELVKASVGFVNIQQSCYENKQHFVVVIFLVNLLCQYPNLMERAVSRSPQSPSEVHQDAPLLLVEALAMMSMSSKISGYHRQWAIEQLRKCLSKRIRIADPESINFADLTGVMPKCETVEILGHDNRVSCLKWSDKRKQLCTAGGYDGTVRTYSFPQQNKIAQPENVLIFQKPHTNFDPSISGEVISALEWNSKGTILAASMNYCLNVWTLYGSEPANCHVEDHSTLITALAFPRIMPQGDTKDKLIDYLLVGRMDGSVAILTISTNSSFSMKEIIQPNSSCGVSFIEWPNSEGSFAVGYFDGLVKFLRKDPQYKPFSQRAHLGCLTAMTFDSIGESFFTCGDDKMIRIWIESTNHNMTSASSYYWLCVQEIELDQIPTSLTCNFVPSNSCFPYILAVGMSNGTVSVWLLKSFKTKFDVSKTNMNEAKFMHCLRCNPFYPVTSLAINSNGTILATGNSKGNGLVNFWCMQYGILLYTHCGSGGVQQICWIGEALACCFTRSREVAIILYNEGVMKNNIVFATCRKSLLEQGLNILHNMPAFKSLLNYLPLMLKEQYLYEKAKVDGGDHLLHSRYLQSIGTLALNLGLDQILDDRSLDPLENPCPAWEWLSNIGTVTKTAEALISRTELPSSFVDKFEIDETSLGAEWSLEMDNDLIDWSTKQPLDWQYGGKVLVFMFGAGRHGQLGDAGRNLNAPKLAKSFLGASQVICGQNCTFLIHANGSVSSLGEGSYGRLGHGSSDDLQTQSIIAGLSGYTIVQLATSIGSDGHSVAMSDSGEVFSWGDGDYGKLGHGSSDRQRRPKQIESLRNEKIIQVAVGWKHSCFLTDSGAVYVCGSCEFGRLGLGITSGNKKLPEKLNSLANYQIGYIACGLAHTICISNDGNTVFAFGDGENGKLGLGNTTTAVAPQIVESLQDVGIAKVACGSQFSVFLTRTGRLLTCGLDKFIAQSSGRSCTLRPSPVMALSDKVVVDIAVGAEHTLCVCADNEVFGWGSNAEGQLGFGKTFSFQKDPEKIKSLSGKGIQQVSAGRTHSAAWTAPRGQNSHLLLGLPTSIPSQYHRLLNIPIPHIRSRLKLLNNFSDLLFATWRFLPLLPPVGYLPNENETGYAPSHGKLRTILTPKVTTLPFVRTICRTMIQQRTYGPTITVRRITPKGKKKKPIFTQISKQVIKLNPQELRLSSRAWKVKLIGEGADDAGGVFDDTITEMCIELATGIVNFLIPTPNATSEIGYNRDKFLLNPELTSLEDLEAYKFIGILFGVAIRTKKPVAIPLASIIWKSLVGQEITIDDLEEVDSMYIQGLRSIRDNVASQFDEKNFHEIFPLECYEGTSSTGKIVPIVSGGRNIALNFQNRLDYVEKAIHFRLHEMDLQVASIREGLSGIIPVPLLSLMTGNYLEQLVCGLPNISVSLLKQVVRYREMDEQNQLVQWLWSTLEEFSNAERVLFMRFVSGRSRLPSNVDDFSQRFQVMRVDRPVDGLPTAQTCFFQLRLPPYSSQEKMAEKLRYAINNCTCIDMDNYMLARNTGFDVEDDDDDVEILN